MQSNHITLRTSNKVQRMILYIKLELHFWNSWKVHLTLLKKCNIINVKLAFRNVNKKRCKLKNRLEEVRKQHDLKQEELADNLEVSRQTIGSLENGRYNPSIIFAEI